MASKILFLVLPAALTASPVMSAPGLKQVLDGETAVSDDELAGMRAGFFTAGGAQFDFGASIKTMVNGELALQTSLQWTQAGAVTQQLAGLGQSIQSRVNNVVAANLAQAGIASPVGNNAVNDATSNAASNAAVAASNAASAANNATGSAVQTANAAAATPATAAPAAAAPAAAAEPAPAQSGSATVNAPAAAPAAATPAAATPAAAAESAPAQSASATVNAPAAVTGVEVPGPGGLTQVLSVLTPNQIQNIILNSANGQSITQDTNITFTIYNFQAWQQQLAERAVSARLAGDMLAASGFAAGH